MTKTFEEEVKEAYERASINLYGNIAGSIGMKKLLNELKDAGLLKEQQALPVVPEDVAKWIEKDKNYGRSVYDGLHRLDYEAGEIAPREVAKWVFDNKENLNLFTRAWLDGYTVEKPQLFYLKNKLTGDCLAICLARASSGLYVEVTEKWLTRKEQTSYKLYFTQQEIDSMQTGSYEQIEVEK